jgi:hypothetical protein
MEPLQIFEGLSERGRLPVEAIHAARECRAVMVPLFLERIERFTSSDRPAADPEADSLFLAFHLLGEWREKTAYRPLAKFLRSPWVELALGEGITSTVHRVMAAVFDGDSEPLREIVQDANADEFVRKRSFDAMTMLTMSGDSPHGDMIKFLETCFSELRPQQDCYVWQGLDRFGFVA